MLNCLGLASDIDDSWRTFRNTKPTPAVVNRQSGLSSKKGTPIHTVTLAPPRDQLSGSGAAQAMWESAGVMSSEFQFVRSQLWEWSAMRFELVSHRKSSGRKCITLCRNDAMDPEPWSQTLFSCERVAHDVPEPTRRAKVQHRNRNSEHHENNVPISSPSHQASIAKGSVTGLNRQP